MATTRRPVAVTGFSVAAPNGLGVDKFWSATLDSRVGIDAISRFDHSSYPVSLAGEVSDFDAEALLPSRLMPQTDHMTRMALVLSDWAIADAGVDTSTIDPFAMGVSTASTSGGLEFGQHELEKLYSLGWNHVSAYMSFAWYYAVNTGQISIRHGMRGPGGVTVTEQAGGLDAIGHARRQVRGGAKVMITGGIDSALCPYGLACHLESGRLSRADDPNRAFLPFGEAASGHVMGEGGAIFVLEDAEAAADRGATSYGTVAGYAATFDPDPDEAPGLRAAAENALADAGLTVRDVDVVFADAAGLPKLDRQEADALTALFGPAGVPVTAPKSMIGRLCAGGAAVDVATALLALRDGVIPPTANVAEAAPGYDIDLVTSPRRRALSTALVLGRGYGGFNAALVVTAP